MTIKVNGHDCDLEAVYQASKVYEGDFYYNLVLRSFAEHPDLGNAVMEYDCFTDITFNPDKGINCQAAAIANYVYLRRNATPHR